MFSFKSFSAIAIFCSVLFPGLVMAYPKASRQVELDYILASFENFYGEVTPEIAERLATEYDNQSANTDIILSGGYQICDGIQLANQQGISSQTLIEQEIAQLDFSNGAIERNGISLTKPQIVGIYNTAKDKLCPELN